MPDVSASTRRSPGRKARRHQGAVASSPGSIQQAPSTAQPLVSDTASDARRVVERPYAPRLSVQEFLISFSVYTVLVTIIAWPLWPRLNSQIIGPQAKDNFYEAWSLWWFKQALFSGQDPGHTHMVFALLPRVQMFLDHVIDNILSIPVQIVAGPLVAYNLMVLLSFVLAGAFTYLLASWFVSSWLARFTAGFLFTFSTYHFAQSMGHLGLLTIEFIPLAAWAMFVFFHCPRQSTAILVGLSMALVVLSEVYFLPYFVLPFVLLFVAGKALTAREWFFQKHNLVLSAQAIAVCLVLSLPYLLTYLFPDPDMRATVLFLGQQDTERLSSDLLGFFLPHPANPIFGARTLPVYINMAKTFNSVEPTTPFAGGETSYLGFVTIILGSAAFLFRVNRGRRTVFWLVVSLIAMILALGPTLFIDSHRVFSYMPYRWLYGTSLMTGFRAPSRLSVVAVLGLSVLAAFTVEQVWCLVGKKAVRRGAVVVLAGTLLCASYAESALISWTIPTVNAATPGLYTRLAAMHTPGLLLDLPIVPTGGYQYYQYFQVVHHKPLLEGFGPRISGRELASIANIPFLAQFDVQHPGGPSSMSSSVDPVHSFESMLQNINVAYVVLHNISRPGIVDLDTLSPQRYQTMRTYLLTNLGAPMYDNAQNGLTAWVIPLPSSVRAPVSIGRGSGWRLGVEGDNQTIEWMGGNRASVRLTASRSVSGSLLIRIESFSSRPQNVEILARHHVLLHLRFARPYSPQTIRITGIHLPAGSSTLTFVSDQKCVRGETSCLNFGLQQVGWSGGQ